jgi:hypothetical protein
MLHPFHQTAQKEKVEEEEEGCKIFNHKLKLYVHKNLVKW